MKHLVFKVNCQTLKRLDSFKPAADSVDYLTASFTFSEDWNGATKTAKCRRDNKVYSAIINSSGVCNIPYEVLAQDEAKRVVGRQDFYISVEGKNGTKTITTDEIKIELSLTGAGEEVNAADPTPDIYTQFIADVTAATKENADTATAEAESAAASATEAAASAASLKNDYSNALKGKASGAVVRVDDVAPVEHFPVVKVRGKNLFNISAITNTDTATNNGDGSITVAANTYYCRLAQTLKEVCPQLNAGDTAVLSFNSTSANTRYMYFHGLQSTWNAGHYITLTEDILNSYVTIYGFPDTSNGQECVISDIQIEIGTTATEYTPYIEPATITLTRCGKNIHQCKAKTQTLNGVTFTVNADGSVTANGTATKATFIGLGSLSVKEGEKYRLSGSPAGSGFETYLLYIHNNTTGGDIYDLGEGKIFTAKAGDLGLTIAVYANTTVNNLIFKPMVIYGEEIEAFEPYNGETYTPETDGTINGLTSISPTMTLLTDHEGITIDCEYNRDINKALARLEALLNS